jgi:hypothetical protein
VSGHDEEIRAALRRDEALVPNLSAIRREVAGARAARRNRNALWAGGLIAACVLVVSTAVAMSAFRTSDPAPGYSANVPMSDSIGHSAALVARTAGSSPTQPSTANPAPSVVNSVTTAVGPTNTSRPGAVSAIVPSPPPELVAIPVLPVDSGGPLRHCQSQSIAWPVTSTGQVNTVALRQAVNECSVGFGNGPIASAQYSLPTLAEVIRKSSLFATARVPDDVDLKQQVLVVRMAGRFPELSTEGHGVSVVQIYLTATDAQWIGAEDSAPASLSSFGAPVLPVP